MKNSGRQNIFTMWLQWHFYQMPVFLFSAWKNYLAFGLRFFSAPLLLSTLFSPWKKYRWNYPRTFNIIEYANTFVSNTFSRIVGALIRLVLIILGFFAQIFIFLAGIVVILAWLFIPLILIALLYYGFKF
jgi:hypothetical protein